MADNSVSTRPGDEPPREERRRALRFLYGLTGLETFHPVKLLTTNRLRRFFREHDVEDLYDHVVMPFFAQPKAKAMAAATVALRTTQVGAGAGLVYTGAAYTANIASGGQALGWFTAFFVLGHTAMAAGEIARSHISINLASWMRQKAFPKLLLSHQTDALPAEQLVTMPADSNGAGNLKVPDGQVLMDDINNWTMQSTLLLLNRLQNQAELVTYSAILLPLSPKVFGAIAAIAYVRNKVITHISGGLSVISASMTKALADERVLAENIVERRNHIVANMAHGAAEEDFAKADRAYSATYRQMINQRLKWMMAHMVFDTASKLTPFVWALFRFSTIPDSIANGIAVKEFTTVNSAAASADLAMIFKSQNSYLIVEWENMSKRILGLYQRSEGKGSSFLRFDVDAPFAVSVENLRPLNPRDGKPFFDAPLSFTLNPGDRLLITGDSGSGKSVLTNYLNEVAACEQGSVTYGGFAARKPGDIVYLRQKPYAETGSLRTVLYRPKNGAVTPEDADKFSVDTIRDVFGKVGLLDDPSFATALEPLLRDPDGRDFAEIGELSGGQLHRLYIARALLHKPKVLILDEVTSQVGPAMAARLYGLIHTMLPDTAVLSIAHYTAAIESAHNKHLHFIKGNEAEGGRFVYSSSGLLSEYLTPNAPSEITANGLSRTHKPAVT